MVDDLLPQKWGKNSCEKEHNWKDLELELIDSFFEIPIISYWICIQQEQ